MSKEVDNMIITSDDENIIIKLPLELLVFAANNGDFYPMRIVDKEGFKKEFIHRLYHFGNMNDIEKGTTRLFETFDDLINDMYESGLDCIVEASEPLWVEEKEKTKL